MTVSSRHPKYNRLINSWSVVRDVVNSDVKKYIPDIDPSDRQRSKLYRDNAHFTNFTGRTKSGLVGSIFRKEPHISLVKEIQYLEDDCTGYGETLQKFCQEVTGEVTMLGRYGILTDFPKVEEGLTAYDIERLDIKARFSKYPTESIINWNEQRINGKYQLSLVVLLEVSDALDDDGFTWKEQKQYRVLRLINGVYVQELYNEDEELIDSYIPTDASGKTWEYIPFEFIGSEDNDADTDPLPLYDLAMLNIGHLKNSADYEESVFVCGQPMLTISSDLSAQEWEAANPGGIKIGSRKGLQLGPGGNARFLQASPNVMADEAMRRKEQQAIMIGAKLITPTVSNETAEAARMRYSGETSILTVIAHNIEDAIVKSIWHALRFTTASWDSYENEDIILTLNDQFFDVMLDANTIMAQIQLAEKGIIAVTDVRTLLRKHGHIEENRTDKDIDNDPTKIEYIPEGQTPQRDLNPRGTGEIRTKEALNERSKSVSDDGDLKLT